MSHKIGPVQLYLRTQLVQPSDCLALAMTLWAHGTLENTWKKKVPQVGRNWG